MSLSDVVTVVGLASSIALVVSVCLLAYNIMVSRRDARRNLAFSMMEQFTSSHFADRRWKMRRCIAAAAGAGWAGFDDSQEDFESRSFAYQYELIAQMVRSRYLSYPLVRDFLQHTVIADWNAFVPRNDRLMTRYAGNPSPWLRFYDLAERIQGELHGPPIVKPAPPPAPTVP